MNSFRFAPPVCAAGGREHRLGGAIYETDVFGREPRGDGQLYAAGSGRAALPHRLRHGAGQGYVRKPAHPCGPRRGRRRAGHPCPHRPYGPSAAAGPQRVPGQDLCHRPHRGAVRHHAAGLGPHSGVRGRVEKPQGQALRCRTGGTHVHHSGRRGGRPVVPRGGVR